MAVFGDELTNLFPDDERAQRLKKQTFMLGDYLEHIQYQPPKMSGKALIQGHCHQAAVFGLDGEKKMLEKMGVETTVMDSGCCGLAGSFGFEADKYDLSMQIAHRAMVPRIQESPPDTLIVANGFSCHTQIADATDRKPVHLAEVIRMGLDERTARQAAAALKHGRVPEGLEKILTPEGTAEVQLTAGRYTAQAIGLARRHPFFTIIGMAVLGVGIGLVTSRRET